MRRYRSTTVASRGSGIGATSNLQKYLYNGDEVVCPYRNMRASVYFAKITGRVFSRSVFRFPRLRCFILRAGPLRVRFAKFCEAEARRAQYRALLSSHGNRIDIMAAAESRSPR